MTMGIDRVLETMGASVQMELTFTRRRHPYAQSAIIDIFSQKPWLSSPVDVGEINSLCNVLCESRQRIYDDFPLRINPTFALR